MSLQERVFGLETEYAVNFYPAEPTKMPGQRLLVQTLQELLAREYGLPDSEYVVSGGKFHYDVGHAEWSSPECLTAREAALYDKAADLALARIVPQAQQHLAIQGYEGKLLVVKNNVDSAGNTYGCHENYFMLRNTDLLSYEHFLRYIMHSLIPFLVTRQIFAGAGRLLPASSTDGSPAHFEISQRAAFIDTAVSFSTTRERPILNLGREYEALAGGNRRRFHLILGDANLSGWATWLKLGTTGIMLRMLEDLFIHNVPILLDPVRALRTVAQDLSLKQHIPLRQRGKGMTALDIQWHYYTLADSYFAQFDASQEEEQIMQAWEEALTDLEQDYMRLRDRADWVIKKHLLDSYLKQQGASWEHLEPTQLEALSSQDLLYHNLGDAGLFGHVFQPDTLLTTAEIAHAQQHPPQYTRARIRGAAIQQARSLKQRVMVDRWQDIVIDGKKISLPDPLTFDCAQLDFDEQWWAQSLVHPDRLIRLRTLKRLAWQPQTGALTLLIQQAEHNNNAQERKAAVEALGFRADKQAQSVLLARLNDSDNQVRWAAEEAIEQVTRGVPTPDPNAIIQAEEEKPLIRIIS